VCSSDYIPKVGLVPAAVCSSIISWSFSDRSNLSALARYELCFFLNNSVPFAFSCFNLTEFPVDACENKPLGETIMGRSQEGSVSGYI
jgi:hypothetical protein